MTLEGLIPAHAGKTMAIDELEARVGAHPRSRGENRPKHWPVAAVMGSSPLTRGKQRIGLQSEEELGLIPAHAGKTLTRPLMVAGMGAHPRSRGENELERVPGQVVRGSSPLTRGKQYLRPHRGSRNGLIPAHAGKTSSYKVPGFRAGAHPRSRGENFTLRIVSLHESGSSPLTRGKPMEGSAGIWCP